VDAVDLQSEIDLTVMMWHPPVPAGRKHPTMRRLAALDDVTFRPQDTGKVTRWSVTARGWASRIKTLLDPEAVKTISAPCPACGTETVWRRDSTGEAVRQPALQLVTNQGCTCMACRTSWTPDKYLWLCKLLGFQLPEGVLD
jgi:hypothetical protein